MEYRTEYGISRYFPLKAEPLRPLMGGSEGRLEGRKSGVEKK